MKQRVFLSVLCGVLCVLGMGISAQANTLTPVDSSFVGLVFPGVPANLASELNYIDYLRNLSAGSVDFGGNTYDRSSNFQPAPDILPNPFSLLWTDCANGPTCETAPTVSVKGYVLGKYDATKAGMYVWYFANATEITLPQNLGDCGSGGCGLSHFAYNAGDGGGQPPPVPEPATLALLGGGLGTIGTLMRRRK